MTSLPTDAAMAAWKQQFDVAFQVAEAIVEGTEKAREIQLAAAADTRAWLEAARKSFSAASGAELPALQARLANENLAKIAQYWSQLAANARNTQVRITELLVRTTAAAPLLAEKPLIPATAVGLNELFDESYKRWIEALRVYATPAS